jgi:hypothetical protein
MAPEVQQPEYPYCLKIETATGVVDLRIAFSTWKQVEALLQSDFKRLVQEAGVEGAPIHVEQAMTVDGGVHDRAGRDPYPFALQVQVHRLISVVVLGFAAKLVMESIIETSAATILQFFARLCDRRLMVTFEDSTCAAWLCDLNQNNKHGSIDASKYYLSQLAPRLIP